MHRSPPGAGRKGTYDGEHSATRSFVVVPAPSRSQVIDEGSRECILHVESRHDELTGESSQLEETRRDQPTLTWRNMLSPCFPYSAIISSGSTTKPRAWHSWRSVLW